MPRAVLTAGYNAVSSLWLEGARPHIVLVFASIMAVIVCTDRKEVQRVEMGGRGSSSRVGLRWDGSEHSFRLANCYHALTGCAAAFLPPNQRVGASCARKLSEIRQRELRTQHKGGLQAITTLTYHATKTIIRALHPCYKGLLRSQRCDFGPCRVNRASGMSAWVEGGALLWTNKRVRCNHHCPSALSDMVVIIAIARAYAWPTKVALVVAEDPAPSSCTIQRSIYVPR